MDGAGDSWHRPMLVQPGNPRRCRTPEELNHAGPRSRPAVPRQAARHLEIDHEKGSTRRERVANAAQDGSGSDLIVDRVERGDEVELALDRQPGDVGNLERRVVQAHLPRFGVRARDRIVGDVVAEEGRLGKFAREHYGFSLMHCMPVSLASGGAGLGTVWGQQLAKRMLAEAGFDNVQILDTPRPQNCSYVCRRG